MSSEDFSGNLLGNFITGSQNSEYEESGSPESLAEENVNVQLEINYGSETAKDTLSIAKGETALDALEINHEVQGKEYVSMGFFITAIDGVEQSDTHSWLFFVDGEPSQVSVDNTILEEDTEIEFLFISNDEAMGYF